MWWDTIPIGEWLIRESTQVDEHVIQSPQMYKMWFSHFFLGQKKLLFKKKTFFFGSVKKFLVKFLWKTKCSPHFSRISNAFFSYLTELENILAIHLNVMDILCAMCSRDIVFALKCEYTFYLISYEIYWSSWII